MVDLNDAMISYGEPQAASEGGKKPSGRKLGGVKFGVAQTGTEERQRGRCQWFGAGNTAISSSPSGRIVFDSNGRASCVHVRAQTAPGSEEAKEPMRAPFKV